jgi:predicted ATPase
MVGRESVLATVTHWLEAALGGGGRSLIVFGAPGMGKTQVARAAADAASRRGVSALWGQCRNRDCDPPLLPLAEIVLRGLESEPTDALADYPQIALMMRAVMGNRATRSQRAPQASLCHELLTLIRHKAPPTGGLIILEDVEAADRATLDILGLGLTRLVGLPIAILMTCAQDGPTTSKPLDDSLARVAGSLDAITLQPLSRSAVSTLAGQFSGCSLSHATTRKIHRLACGNPLLIRQICLSMASGVRHSDL